MSLPIFAIQSDFLTTLANNHVVVSAATGSGKSTCLPLWARAQGRVLVIEPRRIACTSLAEYLAQQDNTELGDQIGYAIRFEQHFTEHTQVVFATPGVALRWYFENQLSDFDVVMLDEFHERRWDMDLLLALLKVHNQHRLIVTSATLNTKPLIQYLQAATLHSEGKMFLVEERFIANDSRAMPSKYNLSERVREACEQALDNTDGDILVFLPGKAEIQAAAGQLSHLDALVVRLYGGCNPQQQRLALNVQSQQRVILATNVAETSLTIPNVSCVIDSGLERRTHLRGGKTVLNLEAIAKDSAKQRLGRAGRTQSGLCIRLYGEHAPLIDTTPPEIHRENLTELVLAAACSSNGVDSMEFIEPLPQTSKAAAITMLTQINAIDAQQRATALGKQLYPLPIDAQLAYLICAMPSKSLQQAMVDAISVLSVPARVYQLPSSPEQIDALNKRLPNHCDLEFVIALVREQLEDIKVEPDALKEAQQFSDQLRIAFDLPQRKHAASYDRNQLIEAIAKAKPDWLFVKRNNRRGAFGNGKSEVIPAKETRINDNCKAMLVLDTYALAGKGTKQAMTLATLNAPVSLNLVTSLGLGEQQFIDACLVDGRVMAKFSYAYAGLELNEQLVEPAGQLLIDACVALILKGELLAPAGKQITQSLAEHQLYLQAHGSTAESVTTQQYLQTKLQELGLQEQDDIELIEPQDLFYQQLEPWELEPFIEKHPLHVQLNDLLMQVEYSFTAKRIVLNYVSGNRKDAPKKWELPAWPGFKVRYKKASKVVDVK
ncbi:MULTISPECIES: DEAD/DEAH box helicase [Pseudoalteromonas]|uniref:ATP-dependent helicase n=1 Tax=Pseudoalteromonas amylolytica TaxID=1859457 RepID=A0A1S1MVB0_9GAMM|nr:MULTISPECIES: DEAD/DEAH box helicase [Pseudoalteromonas]OHU87428.1 ATP-dependent helicase [Pseudoalteromonas sp. JW3]OHU90869.1 ATP-dependent helicase [Pseudoalteromonas amylolytica]